MYRIKKRCVKSTINYCLNCKFCKVEQRGYNDSVEYISCTAENRVLIGKFNPQKYYCLEYPGFKDLSEDDKNKIRQDLQVYEAEKNLLKFTKLYNPADYERVKRRVYKNRRERKNGQRNEF